MINTILVTNRSGNVLLERFYGIPGEERSTWRAFLLKLGAENLEDTTDEEELVAAHRTVFVVYGSFGDLNIYMVGGDEYDELGLSEVLRAVVITLKDACNGKLSEGSLLTKYGTACLYIDEIISQGTLEHVDKDRIKRSSKMKPVGDS
ncbi:SNARE-like superfamily protein [Klebsormidium nitens]|uniref:Coatomer subunit zeta n=1 Tax=Klebsormidium nitens TaxID=105231 RepID=A0A1Y1HMX8_KLENI|nr:SNARE-like superfamily protein [Klebsormidium nitens]|eukprot:GAQ78539.1 SNARE-like superfamily protein [Klebsormidium nitens]